MAVKASATITIFDVSDGKDGTSVTVKSIGYATTTTNSKPSSIAGSFPSNLTKGTYLWSRVTFSDGKTSDGVSYLGTDGDITEAISQAKAAAQDVVDSLEIGGRNLIKNSNFNSSTDYWVNSNMDSFEAVIDDTYETALEIMSSNAGSAEYRIYQDIRSNFTHESGVTYTLSFYAKADSSATLQSNVAGGEANSKNYTLTTSWQRFTNTYTAGKAGSLTFWPVTTSVNIYLTRVKLEKGNKATDWTSAPEDVEEDISDAMNASETASQEYLKDYMKNTLGVSDGFTMDLESVNKFISSGIIGSDGASLVSQTEDGWVFSLASIEDAISSAADKANDAGKAADNVAGNLENLNTNLTSNGLWEIAKNITISASGTSAIITIGGTNAFKLQLANDQITFLQDDNAVAYIKSNKEYISKAQLTDELQFGGEDEDPKYVWKMHNNGNNLGLIWKGDD